ncbi:hypothetical protein JHD49_08455, partial [Sulfurimonas sp. SAG-AH-194-C21]|nr:hypothetical protein [Sulfurimonas sp. SAG-AH-194-C21]
TQKFYKKELSNAEKDFIGSSDGYWAIVTLINVLIQVSLIFNEDDVLWAFYSSLGWVIFLASALILQILYGKLYSIKKTEEL